MAELISLIIPCYNEAECLDFLYQEMVLLARKMPEINFEALFVDDGSTDGTLEIIKEICETSDEIDGKYLSFSRNFGKEAAMLAGLQHAAGDYIAILDADMQDPPALLKEMFYTLKQDKVDCVATRRSTRTGEPPIRSFFARAFYRLFAKISKVEVVDGARDFRIMTRQMADSILSLKESNRFSKGLFAWVGFTTKYIEYENVSRKGGKTKWSFWKLVLYSIEGIVSFSTAPLILVSVMGILICVWAVIMIFYFVIQKLTVGIDIDGYAAMICIILFLGGIQIFSIGILGQYLARVFVETKGRPQYIVKETSESLENALGKQPLRETSAK